LKQTKPLDTTNGGGKGREGGVAWGRSVRGRRGISHYW